MFDFILWILLYYVLHLFHLTLYIRCSDKEKNNIYQGLLVFASLSVQLPQSWSAPTVLDSNKSLRGWRGLVWALKRSPPPNHPIPFSTAGCINPEEKPLEKQKNGWRKEEVEIVTTERPPPPPFLPSPPFFPLSETSKMTSPLAQWLRSACYKGA